MRKSRTSQRNVLCVRLADDSVPSFVQQFGIREEQSSKTSKRAPGIRPDMLIKIRMSGESVLGFQETCPELNQITDLMVIQDFLMNWVCLLSALSLEMSAISFPDLPRLVSFYCVSR